MDELTINVISLCKRRGFAIQNSEIYGGISGFWDYGPYGVQLKKNIENLWWKHMVEMNDNIVGLDSTIISNPLVWKASGHCDRFSDTMINCINCNVYHRVDKMLDKSKCSSCGSTKLTEPKELNLMMKTNIGSNDTYLRPETCQSIFTNYKFVQSTTRQKIPFGIAQIGKAFRNEINPRNFLFRLREFTQMEMEYFCFNTDALNNYEMWKNLRMKFYHDVLHIHKDCIRFQSHKDNELAHYAKAGVDIEFKFPFGWDEIEGIHHRGTHDLSRHETYSKSKMKIRNEDTKIDEIPTVIETSCGLDRVFFAILLQSYDEDVQITQKKEQETDTRVVLRLPLNLVPIQVAVMPLATKLRENAREVNNMIKGHFRCEYDECGKIGKAYRRQDEIGTPFCITIDHQTLEDNKVTLRYRDSITQDRIEISKLIEFISKLFE